MSKFFNYYPKIYYTLSNNSTSLDTITNITSRFAFQESLKKNSSVFYQYIIQDGDKPEILAHKYYGNSEYHWVILLFNNLIDPYFDWPLDSTSFNDWVNAKYSGVDNIVIENPGSGYSNGFLNIISVDGVGSGANAEYTVNSTGAIVNVEIKDRGSFYNQSPNIFANTGNNAIFSSNEITSYYGSDWAQNIVNIQAYYKEISRTSSYNNGTTITEKIQITPEEFANTGTSSQDFTTADGLSCVQTISTSYDTFFDYENNLNEAKRTINLLKPEFLQEVLKEFKSII